MSHVVSMKIKIKSLNALKRAAKTCGLELVRDVKTYKWFGRHVGDFPMPEGFTKDDLGKCDHVLRVIGANHQTYEVGVVKSKTGSGYELLWDFWQGGYGLEKAVGKNGQKLMQQYAYEVALAEANASGYTVEKIMQNDGSILLVAR